MRFSTMRVWIMCMAATAALAVGFSADAFGFDLTYKPKSGEKTVYDLQVNSKVTDQAGQTLDTALTSTLTISVDKLKEEPGDDESQIVEAVVDLSQTNGSITFTSGEQKKTVALEDKHVTVVANKDGKITNLKSGTIDKSLTDTLAAICAKLGSTDSPSGNMTWNATVPMQLGAETVDVDVAFKLEGLATIGKAKCVDISSTASFSKDFSGESSVKKFNMDWTGHAYYNDELGRFEQVSITAKAKGILADDTETRVTNYTFLMMPKAEEAALPADHSVLAGFFRGLHLPLSMLLGVAFTAAFACVIARFRSLALRKALVCCLTVAIVLFGMPMEKAEAASPSALVAFSQMANQAMLSAGGFTTAGGTGLCMTGAPAGSLSVSAAALPGMTLPGVTGAFGQVDAGLVQVTAAGLPPEGVAGTQETAGAGVFTATNMLIGGGVIGASAGAFALASDSGGSSSDKLICTTSTIAPMTTDQSNVFFLVGKPTIDPALSDETDRITVSLNGTPVAGLTNISINADYAVPVALPLGANQITIECTDPGTITNPGQSIFDFAILSAQPILEATTVKACQGTPIQTTLTRVAAD